MKILVFGHSDSDGSRLTNQADAWPWLLQRDVSAATGSPVQLVHRLLFAGPSAARFVERQLESERPDVVVLATSTYSLVVQLVSNRIRERFGAGPANLVGAAERFVDRSAGHLGPTTSRPLLAARQIARRTLGTAPAISLESLLESYDQCLRALARAENVQTIVLGGVGYDVKHQRLNPSLNATQDQANLVFERMTREHRMDFLIHEQILGGRLAKERYYFADGVHTDERANRLAADAMLPLILARS